jgi:hypothetical protein
MSRDLANLSIACTSNVWNLLYIRAAMKLNSIIVAYDFCAAELSSHSPEHPESVVDPAARMGALLERLRMDLRPAQPAQLQSGTRIICLKDGAKVAGWRPSRS